MYIINDARTAVINTENISGLTVEGVDADTLELAEVFGLERVNVIFAYLQNAKIIMGIFAKKEVALAVYRGLMLLLVKFPKSKCVFMDKLIDEVLDTMDFDEDEEDETLD